MDLIPLIQLGSAWHEVSFWWHLIHTSWPGRNNWRLWDELGWDEQIRAFTSTLNQFIVTDVSGSLASNWLCTDCFMPKRTDGLGQLNTGKLNIWLVSIGFQCWSLQRFCCLSFWGLSFPPTLSQTGILILIWAFAPWGFKKKKSSILHL